MFDMWRKKSKLKRYFPLNSFIYMLQEENSNVFCWNQIEVFVLCTCIFLLLKEWVLLLILFKCNYLELFPPMWTQDFKLKCCQCEKIIAISGNAQSMRPVWEELLSHWKMTRIQDSTCRIIHQAKYKKFKIFTF